MSTKLIQKLKSEREEEKLSKKNIYITLIASIMTLGFGSYFYLNRAKDMILIIFFVFIVGGISKGQAKLTNFTIPDGRGGNTEYTIRFNFIFFTGISILDNISVLAIAKKKQKEKSLQGMSILQMELLKLIKEKQEIALVDLVLETELSVERLTEALQSLADSKLIQVADKESDNKTVYKIV